MFKTRRKVAEEEAKQDPNYVPTKELHCTEPIEKRKVPVTALIIFGVLVAIIVACIIVIVCCGGPVKS